MQQPDACPRCRGSMEPGFVIDRGHHSTAEIQKWVEGPPESSI